MIEFEIVQEEPDEAIKVMIFLWENRLVSIGELQHIKAKNRADLDLAISLGIQPSRIKTAGEKPYRGVGLTTYLPCDGSTDKRR